MVLLDFKTINPKELAAQLLAEQAVIEQYLDGIRELEERVLAYEQKFGIESADVHEAIDSGRLKETLEVCDWLMDFEMLKWNKTGDH